MDDCIIEGIDTIISDEEIVSNWDTKASRKIINKLSVCENEKVLDDVLRDYVWVLQHQALNFKLKKLLKEKIITHVKVFHLCCITTSNLPTELQSYWENMENVLVILCNLELDVVRHLKLDNIKDYKEKIVEVTTKLIYMLSVFLLNNNTRICHVLLKLSVRYDSRAWKDVMKVVYRHFLVMVPVKDKSEENFCRNYLLFQNYKKLTNKENHVKMDSVLFERFNMNPDIISKSRTLKKILLPSISSIIDLVDMLTDCRQTAVDNYFKHMNKKNRDDDYIPFSINLESDSEDEVQLTIGKKTNNNEISEIKIEDVIEETTNYYDTAHVICVDDDSDVEEISLPIASKNSTKVPSFERTETYVSFLDSIKIPGEVSEEPSTTTDEVLPSTPEETPSTPENSIPSSPLPFLELYLDNLKSKGQVLDTNVSDTIGSNDLNTAEEKLESNTNDNQPENATVEQVLETNDLVVASEAVHTEELNIDTTLSEPITVELQPLKITAKSVEVPTSSGHFNFISGLITPPVSDRTNDDVIPDNVSNGSKNVYVPNMISMDDISYHQYESEVEVAINNSVTLTNSPMSNELGNESCTTDDGTADDNVETELLNNEVINTNLTIESQENFDKQVDENLDLNESLIIQEDLETQHVITETEKPEMIAQVTELTASMDIDDSQHETTLHSEDEQIASENLTLVDMVLDDSQLPTSEIIEIVFNKHPVLPTLNISSDKIDSYEANICKSSEPIDANCSSANKTFEEGSYKNVSKIQASVSMGEIINGMSSMIPAKLNGDNISKASKTKPSCTSYSPEKVIYTSSERVSAPLSVFSKFEQAQSELVENAFSGPIEPMYSYSNVHSDHSNSNDSLRSFPYIRPQSKAKPVSNSTADSPISPPFEHIQSQEYESHLMSVDYDHLISTINTPLSHITKVSDPKSKIHNKKQVNLPSESISSRKRKLDVGVNQQKKTKVNFGPTEVRIIPRDDSKLIEDEVLEEASESMKEYKICANDVKLVYLQPQIPIKIESISELQEKEQQLKIRGLLHNATDRLHPSDNSCILKRIDYKKIAKQMEHSVSSSERNFGHKISNLISKPMESAPIDSIPSGYIPPMNGYSSVHGLQSSNALEQQQTFNNQQSQTSNTFNDNCNSEILNLSVSSILVSELDSPESEFSRSPKLLQNSDQIVQQCLIDNLDNTEIEPVTNVHNNLALLSNNSNFYSTPRQLPPNVGLPPTEDLLCRQQPIATIDNIDKYRNDLEELLLKNELDKLFDDKLNNSESEFSLPLKKRRVLPKLNEANLSFKEEISYPATPMISIAEIEALHQNTSKNTRSFKTPAERKEMPPIPFIYNKNSSEPTPIIADQFNINNHTYNNPTINYHMNSVPLPFINVPCAPYYSFPPFLLPFNNVTTYDTNLNQEATTMFKKEEEPTKIIKTVKKHKKEKKKSCSSKTKDFFEQYVPDKKFIF
ncbi:hypothetical protein RN001_009814 [Aquatica leii]|uniref:Uncharacterized protein n=1 Tax=Aquatica leii TaxID=1421715 RepID=A0AAN7QGU0_9COLE|nr:hypothetical protein RN001_009814 [Aquatica leii]